jgi:hypothetical protein
MRISASQTDSFPACDWFLNNLDEIRSRAGACLCRLRPERREDAVAEVVAVVFCATVRAARRGVLGNVTAFTLSNTRSDNIGRVAAWRGPAARM